MPKIKKNIYSLAEKILHYVDVNEDYCAEKESVLVEFGAVCHFSLFLYFFSGGRSFFGREV